MTPENQHLVSQEAIDLVSKLLRYDTGAIDLRRAQSHGILHCVHSNAAAGSKTALPVEK